MSTLTERITEALERPEHAPMSEHHPVTGECLSCPWPMHVLAPDDMAHLLAAVVAEWLTSEEVIEAVRRPHETVPLEEMHPAARRLSVTLRAEMRAILLQDLSAAAAEATKGADA